VVAVLKQICLDLEEALPFWAMIFACLCLFIHKCLS